MFSCQTNVPTAVLTSVLTRTSSDVGSPDPKRSSCILQLSCFNYEVVTRSYQQFCGIARALDLAGERWALLVVRELVLGPKRFTDLRAGLPGIGSNVLAARLKELEQNGVVARRRLPPPAASAVYELTEYGRELEEVVLAFGRWGA